mmetsp:Transcript_531/g.2078  ORF Transcript_531/g.2078 Transcript_531/m.2078 type:complete len:249 (+) Transcript_531:276-1022(+)
MGCSWRLAAARRHDGSQLPDLGRCWRSPALLRGRHGRSGRGALQVGPAIAHGSGVASLGGCRAGRRVARGLAGGICALPRRGGLSRGPHRHRRVRFRPHRGAGGGRSEDVFNAAPCPRPRRRGGHRPERGRVWRQASHRRQRRHCWHLGRPRHVQAWRCRTPRRRWRSDGPHCVGSRARRPHRGCRRPGPPPPHSLLLSEDGCCGQRSSPRHHRPRSAPARIPLCHGQRGRRHQALGHARGSCGRKPG